MAKQADMEPNWERTRAPAQAIGQGHVRPSLQNVGKLQFRGGRMHVAAAGCLHTVLLLVFLFHFTVVLSSRLTLPFLISPPFMINPPYLLVLGIHSKSEINAQLVPSGALPMQATFQRKQPRLVLTAG